MTRAVSSGTLSVTRLQFGQIFFDPALASCHRIHKYLQKGLRFWGTGKEERSGSEGGSGVILKMQVIVRWLERDRKEGERDGGREGRKG